MKKLIFILLFNIAFNLQAQDTEPSAWKFIWGSSSVPRAFSIDSFQQNKYLKGFQWSGSPGMDNALYNNSKATHGFNDYPAGTYKTKIKIVDQATWQDNGYYPTGTWYAPFMQFEPTLQLDHSNPEKLVRRMGDTTKPVFGS